MARSAPREPLPPAADDHRFLDALASVAVPDEQTVADLARTVKPLPRSVAAAWHEWEQIDARMNQIGSFYPNVPVYRMYEERARLLADLVLHGLEAHDPEECRYRLRMLAIQARRAPGRLDAEPIERTAKALLADLDRLPRPAAPDSAADQGERRRTATERRAAVVGHLCDPELGRWSDRAIARACGVSPQTVSNWRHKLSGQDGQDEAEDQERLFRRAGKVHRMKVEKIGAPPPSSS